MRRKYTVVLFILVLTLCVALSGCGVKIPQMVPSMSEGSVPEKSDEIDQPNEAAETPAKIEDTENSTKLSFEDQKFLDENGYLTHHSEITTDVLSWTFEEATGTLTISGSGPMKDYRMDTPEWAVHKDEVKKIVIEEGITTIGDYAFCDYSYLTLVQLPDTITYIGMEAFANDYQMEEIPFPASLKEIASFAFSEVKVHKPLRMPNGVEMIGCGAFHANDFWDTITIPASVYYIEEGAFSNSLHVHDFIVDPENKHYTAIDGVLYDKEAALLLAYPILKETENFSVPATVTRIANEAFDINFFLRTLYIPKSVKEVGPDQFGLLRQMEEYIVEEGSELFKTDHGALLSKDGKTFYAYPVLAQAEEYTIPDGVESIASRAFAEAWNLKKLYVPQGVLTIGMQAFEGMNGTEIDLPENLMDTVAKIDSTALFSEADGTGWDLGSGFTYVPNTKDCVVAKGKQEPAVMTIRYAGSQEKWDRFALDHTLFLGSTKVICEK